jgi:hypothetical protein
VAPADGAYRTFGRLAQTDPDTVPASIAPVEAALHPSCDRHDAARQAAALDCARRVAWCCSANVTGIAYAERKQAMAQLRGALHALDGADYEARKWPRL